MAVKLSICLAARGRPELLAQTLNQTLSNIILPDTTLVVALDEDDEKTIAAARVVEADGVRLILSIEPRADTIAAKWNRVLRLAPADVYMTMVDHGPQITQGFDRRILFAAAMFPDGIGAIYNHLANLMFPQINAVTAGLVEMMDGKIYPELFPYWFVDHWLDDIARMIGRISFADIWQGEPAMGKPATQEMREPAFWATFYDALAPARRECAHRIIKSERFEETCWRKSLLLEHHPLIEERSFIVNSRVRNLPGNMSLNLDEPRYQRVKQKAVDTLRGMLGEQAVAA